MMKKSSPLFLVMSVMMLLILLMAAQTLARGFRCGTELVSVGDSTWEVLHKCGEPDLKELIKSNGVNVEKWTYNCGSLRFIRILTFSGGALRAVKSGDYGSGPSCCQ